jgi:stage V sporulation protein AD
MEGTKRLGGQTVAIESEVSILGHASVVGGKEGDGPLGKYFDKIENDPLFGEATWEKAERMLYSKTISLVLEKSNIPSSEINYVISGDLLNQCVSSSFAVRDTGLPYLGIYGACSTMSESMSIASMIIDGGFANRIMCIAGSHFCSAEKQFRFPLEYGGQRPPTAQWTVTGCGAVIMGNSTGKPKVTHVTTGKIEDMGIKDGNNMGAAMAPAFVSTVEAHFNDTGRTPADYDLILSGDLGEVGKSMAIELLRRDGLDLSINYTDCGVLVFDNLGQDTHAGGSGCGCSAAVLCSYILPKIEMGEYKRVLFVATGALMSPTTTQQGDSIPSIAHAIAIEGV